jgi:hypothetical protein
MPTRFETSDTDDDASNTDSTQARLRAQTWRERHALKVLGALMVAMLATVIFAQVAC